MDNHGDIVNIVNIDVLGVDGTRHVVYPMSCECVVVFIDATLGIPFHKIDLFLQRDDESCRLTESKRIADAYRPVVGDVITFVVSDNPVRMTNDIVATYANSNMGERVRMHAIHGYPYEWDISFVTVMDGIFSNIAYPQLMIGIEDWDVSAVVSMGNMFKYSNIKSLVLADWNTSNVRNMRGMFDGATNMDELSIEGWDVSNAITMELMFAETTFNNELGRWNVRNVRTFQSMFIANPSFDRDISMWDVSNATDTSYMFAYTESFHGDISQWKLNPDADSAGMFMNSEFDGDIEGWGMTEQQVHNAYHDDGIN
jgi:surface protein